MKEKWRRGREGLFIYLCSEALLTDRWLSKVERYASIGQVRARLVRQRGVYEARVLPTSAIEKEEYHELSPIPTKLDGHFSMCYRQRERSP